MMCPRESLRLLISSRLRAVFLMGALLQGGNALAGATVDTTYDSTQDAPPSRATVPPTAAEVDGDAVAFRVVDGGTLNRSNSALPVAADEGLWRQSLGLPIGSRIRLHVSDVKAPADGHSPVHLTVNLLDAQGQPITSNTKVRVETSLGRLRAPHGKEAAGFEMAVKKGVAQLDLVAPVNPGEALLRVSSGAVKVQGKVSFIPELRPLIVVGMVESGISTQRVTADPNAPTLSQVGFEDSLQHWGTDAATGSSWGVEGRAAAFVKGTIGSDVLLTGSFDTNKINREKFFSDIDPNQYFPIAGDASLINYDARSTSKLYLRLDKDQSHVLYGDFQTVAPTDTAWLGSYARTLTGFTAHYENSSVKANIFGAMESAHQFVDEQSGRGISGPYAVSQANAVANSEIVEILVRDRNQPALILSRQTLTRYADYDFEPFSGEIVFRQPVPSVDENLNPVSIRITYEVDDGGPKYLVDGVNGEFLVRQGWSVGGRYSEDRDPMTPFKLYGADTVVHLNEHTTLTLDAARSEGNQLYAATSTGVLTAASLVAGLTSADPSGNAGRAELVHHDDVLDARVYAGKADLTFENANATLSAGRTEEGLHATYKLTEATQLKADAEHSDDETTDAHRSGATVAVETKLWTGAKIETGVAYVDQTYNSALPAVAAYSVGAVPGTSTGTGLNNTGFGFLGTGLLSSPLGGSLSLASTGATTLVEQDYVAAQAKLTQRITDRFSAYGEYEHTVDGTSGQMAAVGAEYRVTDASRFYVRHEEIDSLTGIYGLGDGTKAEQTVAGFDTSYMHDGTVYNELRLAGTESGQSAADAMGVRNLWHILPGLNATTSVERQEVIAAAPVSTSTSSLLVGTQTATALATGLDYTASPLWKMAERVEYRFSDVQTNWLSTLAVTRKLSDDWSLIGRNVYLSARTEETAEPTNVQTDDRAQVGVAYRDIATNKLNVLVRYEYRIMDDNTPVTGGDSHSRIAAVIANYHPVRAWEFEGQLAAKQVREVVTGVSSDYSAQLAASRVVWDFSTRWDVGVLASTTTGGGSRDQGLALELGHRVFDNLWVSVGAIAGRYADTELFSANSSWRGVYLRMRFKFDEKTFRIADPTTNRTLDAAPSVDRQ